MRALRGGLFAVVLVARALRQTGAEINPLAVFGDKMVL